ncbi:uracil-DNA glycosylase [Leptospirillum ferriphilum]|uniref:Type-5 uracil-DNA glycosylase n=2 Tax=Leptospirillum TaxID=179 RepID=A0A094WEF7_9BACT|nr:uracil-DNA glycosylase [Leptospirillum ferriphilum]EDZ39701.1 MAG: Putative uracil-DNA glycosylase [Leptospirillum sp. Group II '5-way CG']KGA94920.1 Uracil-DNA glycosylase, family 5 [Leptospirillum ferriphilum]
MEEVAVEEDSLGRLSGEIVVCRQCDRLVSWREESGRVKRASTRTETYWSRPLPGFGDSEALLWIIGLAPAAHGGNRTGRVFTGDRSGDFLFRCLYETGWSRYPTVWGRKDGQTLFGAWISAAVRCAPPENTPSPEEFLRCRPFLEREFRQLTKVRAVLVLGALALREWMTLLGKHDPSLLQKKPSFVHGTHMVFPDPTPRLFISYHPSQRNTQTGLLTKEMMCRLLREIRAFTFPMK